MNYRDISAERYRKALEQVNAKYDMKKDTWLIGYYARDTVLLKKKREQEPHLRCELNAAQIGNLLLLTSPGEVFAQMSLDVKAASPFPFTMVSELTNDYLGYVPTPDVFGPGGGGYEGKYGWGSRLETGAFEKMRTKLVAMLPAFKPEREVVKPNPKGDIWVAFRPEEL